MSLFSDFVCDYCDRSFTRKYNLQTHIENCHLNFSSYCQICNQKFGSPAGLQLHLSRGHNRFGHGQPECDICGRIFTRKQNIMSHMITVHLQSRRQDIRCNLCQKTFTTGRNLKRHLNQLHNPNIEYPTCNECNKMFKGKQSLIAHIQSTHNYLDRGISKCEQCNKSYSNNRNLKRHIEMHHGEKGEFKCELCPKVYTSNQSLRRHTRTQHTVECFERYSCDYCSEIMTGKENLYNHIALYHKDSSSNDELRICEYMCEFCDNSYDDEAVLRRHVKTDHTFQNFYNYCRQSLLKSSRVNDNPKKPNLTYYNCEFCNSSFATVYDLKDHMRYQHDKEYTTSTCNVCFDKFFSKETLDNHKKICIPPDDVNSCSYCDKLFTDVSSLNFHIRIFHPQAQIADSNISSNFIEEPPEPVSFKCPHCDRIYYSERSLKHHVKLKHTTEEAVECQYCGKKCNNKYYLASHMKVHSDTSMSKCDYCNKQFKSKRNIRRHIEFTHLGMLRYKCIECETLFKEKRSLRKHVRTKHPNSATFPQCHICHKRFESAKSCKIHLKLIHSFNMNTHPCDLCPVSFTSNEALNIHLSTKHLAKDEIYKCQECNMVFKGHDRFERHNEKFHSNMPIIKQNPLLPRCIICMKDFSTRKTLKRHIKKFHSDFNVDELATYGTKKRTLTVDCPECLKCLDDEFYNSVYQNIKHLKDSIIFTCNTCSKSFTSLEYRIQKYKQSFDVSKNKLYLSELCTTEMSEADEIEDSNEVMEPESTTCDVKLEPGITPEYDIKMEPMSPESSTQ